MAHLNVGSQILHKRQPRQQQQRFRRLPEFLPNAVGSWFGCFHPSIVRRMWKQERVGSSRSPANRPDCRGDATRCPRLSRISRDSGWLCERANPAAGFRLPYQTELFGRRRGWQEPGTFQDRSPPVSSNRDQAKAQVAQAEAQLGKTQLDVQRDTPLAKEKAIAQSQLDNDIQANLATKATVQADKAAVEQAELNLEFTNVRSLVDGVAGIASGQVGNLVGPQIILTTVSQLEPIKAYFTVSEQQYLAFVKRNPTEASREARERQFELELILSDGSIYPRKGRFFAADRHVDIQTGAIRLAGLFPNPGNVLRPGQFGRVRFISYTRIGALLVPQKAITELQGSYQVAVVGNDNKVTLRTVKVGERTGAMWIVDEGIKPGERVVVEGVQKVRDSMLVKPTLVAAQGEGN